MSMSSNCLSIMLIHMCEYDESKVELKDWFINNDKIPEKVDLELRDYEEKLNEVIEEIPEHISTKEAMWRVISAFHNSYLPENFSN